MIMKTKNFLTLNKVHKLRIVQHFLEKTEKITSINYLAVKLDLPIASVKRYINELNDEFLSITNLNTVIKKINTHDYILNDCAKVEDQLYTKLYRDYLNSSNMFHLANLFIRHHKLTFQFICDELSLSKTPVYETIKDLNDHLTSYSVTIDKSESGEFTLVGDELNIRIFICNFLMNGIPEENWPFPFSKESIYNRLPKEYIFKGHSKRMQECFLLYNALILNRIRNGAYLIDNSCNQIPNLNLSLLNEINIIDFDNFFHTPVTKETEKKAYQIMMICLFPDIFSKEQILSTSHEFLQSDVKFALFFNSYLCKISEQLNLDITEELFYYSLFHLTIHSKFARLVEGITTSHLLNLQQDLPQTLFFENRLPWHHKQYIELVDIYDDLITNLDDASLKLILMRDDYTLYINTIGMIISLLYTPKKMKRIKLFLDFGKDSLTKQIIINKIDSIFKSSVYEITDSIDDADLVICNHLYTYPTKNGIFIKDVFDYETTYLISESIHKKMIEFRFKKSLERIVNP